MLEEEKDTPDKSGNHVDGQKDEKAEEMSVIPPSNAVVNPWTMVIKCFNTGITVGAVGASWRTIELTSITPFHPNLTCINFNSLVERSTKVIFGIFFRRSFGYHTWIHKGCQEKVGHDKNGQNNLDNQDGKMVPPDKVWTRIIEEHNGTKDQDGPCNGGR